MAIEGVDPDLLVPVKSSDAARIAGLEAGVVRRRVVGIDGVDAAPALNEHRSVDHYRETTASCRRVVQYLTQ